jgi:hypothetical protein
MVGDGFTPRRDNVMILSSKCLDDTHAMLDVWMQAQTQRYKLNVAELLSGEVWSRPEARQVENKLPFAIIQTMAIIQKAMDEDAEQTTLSHEAVRQLLAASGVLPRNVAAPEWIQEGIAAYFERPFGAVYGRGGLPSWSNLIAYKYHKARNLGNSGNILRQVITDRYFQIARRSSSDQDSFVSAMPAHLRHEKEREDWERARATSWALVYYLVKERKADGLLRYMREIRQMPRDLELDARTLEGAFAKAFNLGDVKSPQKLDPAKFQKFADDWISDMEGVSLELSAVEIDSMKTRAANALPALKKDDPATKGPPDLSPPPPN